MGERPRSVWRCENKKPLNGERSGGDWSTLDTIASIHSCGHPHRRGFIHFTQRKRNNAAAVWSVGGGVQIGAPLHRVVSAWLAPVWSDPTGGASRPVAKFPDAQGNGKMATSV